MKACLGLDPYRFKQAFWPDVTFYKEQWDVVYSVAHNIETVVVAGHQLGKDFVTGFIVLWYFVNHHTCRIITTSVKDDHLRVLWGEIERYLDTAKYPLREDKGGILRVTHREIRKVINLKDKETCKISYLRGMVCEKPEAMAGHHADYAMFVGDEASGIDDEAIKKARTWRKRLLLIGNPYPSQNNYFERSAKAGDKLLR